MQLTELEQQMVRRVRRHLLTTMVGIFVAIALMGGAASIDASDGGLRGWAVALPIVGLMLIPAIGFGSTYKFLRCPACERLVAWQVSSVYSPFGDAASKTCNGCNAKIFRDDTGKRFTRMMIIMVATGVALGIVTAIVGQLL